MGKNEIGCGGDPAEAAVRNGRRVLLAQSWTRLDAAAEREGRSIAFTGRLAHIGKHGADAPCLDPEAAAEAA